MNKGILLALATALISGISIFLSKILVAKIDPVVFTTVKNLFVAVVLSAVVFTPQLKKYMKRLTMGNWMRLITIGIIGGSIPFALFFTGLSMTNATNAAVIHKTLFVWVALFAIPLLHEKLRPVQMLGYVLVLWGVLWTTGLRFSGDTGEWMILGATILWAIENVIAKAAMKNMPGILIAWGRMVFGSVILLGLLIVQGKLTLLAGIGGENLLPFLVSAVLLAGYVSAYYMSLQYIPVTLASSILVLAAPVTSLLEYGFSGKQIVPEQMQSIILTAAGIFLISLLWYKETSPSSSS